MPDDATPRCEHCGYDLRGLVENRCPECGLPFDPNAPPSRSAASVRADFTRVAIAIALTLANILLMQAGWTADNPAGLAIVAAVSAAALALGLWVAFRAYTSITRGQARPTDEVKLAFTILLCFVLLVLQGGVCSGLAALK